MIHYKNKDQVEIMRHSALLVSGTLAEVAKILKPGVTTLHIDGFIGAIIKDHGGTPSFLNFHGYPFNSCISVNDVVVHGFPNKKELQDGDIVSIDIGIYKKGYHGDHAYTFMIGKPADDIIKLVKITKESLYKGVEKAVAGNRIGDIAYAIQEHTEKKNGYGVVRELVGHGVGRELHEKPEVPNYGKRGSGALLKPGMTIAIEPMINMGTKNVKQLNDGWTVVTKDAKPSAHFEHTVAITNIEADVLSTFEPIDEAVAKNEYLKHTLITVH